MFPFDSLRDSGLDLALLGTLVAGLGLALGPLSGSADASPSLVRFFQVPRGTTPPAVLPQDRALLLLTDPRTAPAATGGVDPVGAPGLALVAAGVMLVAVGVLSARRE